MLGMLAMRYGLTTTLRWLTGLTFVIGMRAVSADDQVKAYIKKFMSQLNKWMAGGKISKLVLVITSKETGEHVERWQFDVGAAPLLRSCGPC